jgi:ADP-heptose:LPS heptosyltransferase
MRPTVQQSLHLEAETLPDDIKNEPLESFTASIITVNGTIHHILEDNPKQQTKMLEDLSSHVAMPKLSSSDAPVSVTSGNEPPKEIVFHNRQAIGDVLMFTSAVRDFKAMYPYVRVGVISTARHLWDNNPNIDHQFIDPEHILKIGPGFATNKSNYWDFHMANAYRQDIQNKLGITYIQGPITPDIWMTEEEYKRPPLIDGPYWAFIYGGEPGWPAKQYHRWQEVINIILKSGIKVVQLGVKGHPYPVLDGVINYVGKTEDRNTGLRDLFNIFLHAQGSIGLVSMHMHLSAAFGNPCVVLAGAREPAWFTQYFGHQYFHANGCLPCSAHKACWKTSMKGCSNHSDKTNEIGQKVPMCVNIIEPETIADGVLSYYKGGRLEHGKKIPNTYFKNVTKEKQIFVAPTVKPIDEDLLKKYGFTWGGGAVTDKDWIHMKALLEKYKSKTVLEFGAGLSTLLFGSVVDEIHTFETQPGWIKKIKDSADDNKHTFYNWDATKEFVPPSVLPKRFDFAFVDGPAGGQNREWSTKAAAELADVVIIHDAGREWERKWQDKYLAAGFEGPGKGGHRCHLWVRKELDEKLNPKPVADPNKPTFRMLTTTRGWGGSERSTVEIMNMMQQNGYNIELYPSGVICGEYQNSVDRIGGILVKKWGTWEGECELAMFYASDTIFNYNKDMYTEFMPKFQAKRKTLMLNYRIGSTGRTEWTKNWDSYGFLSSMLRDEFLKIYPDATDKCFVQPPPTDLTDFFKVEPNFDGQLRIVCLNSQGDAKHRKDIYATMKKIWEINKTAQFYFMPAPSFLTSNDSRIHRHAKNQPPVPLYLSQGTLFMYLPPVGFTDQGPRTVIEAHACGLPAICDKRTGGPNDRMTPDTGWLIEKMDDLYPIIREITENPGILKEKGEAARKRAQEFFIKERWIDHIKGENNG